MREINTQKMSRYLVWLTLAVITILEIGWVINHEFTKQKMAQINQAHIKAQIVALKSLPKPPVLVNMHHVTRSSPLSFNAYVALKISSDKALSAKTKQHYQRELKSGELIKRATPLKRIDPYFSITSEINDMALKLKQIHVSDELTSAKVALMQHQMSLYKLNKLNKIMQDNNTREGVQPKPAIDSVSLTAVYTVNGKKMATLKIGQNYMKVAEKDQYPNLGFNVLKIKKQNIQLSSTDGKLFRTVFL